MGLAGLPISPQRGGKRNHPNHVAEAANHGNEVAVAVFERPDRPACTVRSVGEFERASPERARTQRSVTEAHPTRPPLARKTRADRNTRSDTACGSTI